MLLVAGFVLAVATVPTFGGRLSLLAEQRLRLMWTLFAALALQIFVISVVPSGSPALHSGLHIASYGLLALFVFANRKLPGLWLASFGAALNFIAIAANDGVMPSPPQALAVAGRTSVAGHFTNSATISHPKLAFLGDVFAWPAPLPLHNVFSAGDVCIIIGSALILHQVCKSRLGAKQPEIVQPLRPV